MATEHFGMVTAKIDEVNKRIVLELRRGREPQSDSFVQNCRKWAIAVTTSDHGDFELVDKTNGR